MKITPGYLLMLKTSYIHIFLYSLNKEKRRKGLGVIIKTDSWLMGIDV